jgi:hypothetical protein
MAFRTTLAALALATLASPSLAQGVWPEDPWTDTRTVRSNQFFGLGRAVAFSGPFLYASGNQPGTNHGIVGVVGIRNAGYELLSTVSDPADAPSSGFGFPMAANDEFVVVADAGYPGPGQPIEYLQPAEPSNPGRVEVFFRNDDGTLTHATTLENPTGNQRSAFGRTIVFYGNTLAVGAPHADVFGIESVGAVFIYRRVSDDRVFAHAATVLPPTISRGGNFGCSFDFLDNNLVVGWPGYDESDNEGRVVIYEDASLDDVWKPIEIISSRDLETPDGPPIVTFGFAVAARRDSFAVSAPGRPNIGYPGDPGTPGQVFIFERDPIEDDAFLLRQVIEQPTPFGGTRFGSSIAFEPDTFFPTRLVIGSSSQPVGGGVVNVYSRDFPAPTWEREAPLRRINGGSMHVRTVDGNTQVFASANDYGDAVLYSAQAICLPDLRGDANNDGVTNFEDLNAVLASFGQSGADLDSDLNNDNVVDFIDLNFVLVTFGSPCLPPN